MPPLLELVDVHKSFGAVRALHGVGVGLEPRSVHGILGENGAGKSTLMNIAYGLLQPDAGTIRVPAPAPASAAQGPSVPTSFRSPRDAIAAGIGMVHQHFMLAGAMSVMDNVLLGDRRAGQWLDRRAAEARLVQLAGEVGLPVEPRARVASLSVGQQQRVEILKALWRDVRVLILDEPTAVLTPMEADQLLAAIRRLRQRGCAVAFISHKLREVRLICDRLTVLRRGRVVWQGTPEEITDAQLAREMVGHDTAGLDRICVGDADPARQGAETRPPETEQARPTDAPEREDPVLALREVSTAFLANIALEVPAGRIVGIAGVDGNGQQQLAEVIVGLCRPVAGQVLFDGRDVTRWSAARRMNLGLAHIPNDRRAEALVGSLSIAQNIVLKLHDRPPFARWGVIRWSQARSCAQRQIEAFDIRADGAGVPVNTLSGGNQQKVVLARELGIRPPRLIVAMNPARGLDVAATEFVYRALQEHRSRGCAILLISSELDELLALCDNIAVLYAGRLTPTDFPNTDRQTIGRLMAGAAPTG